MFSLFSTTRAGKGGGAVSYNGKFWDAVVADTFRAVVGKLAINNAPSVCDILCLQCNNIYLRQAMSKLRLSRHKRPRITAVKLICKLCNSGIADEIHLLLYARCAVTICRL